MTGMTGVDWPTIQQAAEDVAGVGLASAAAGLLCVRLLARRSMATLLFVVAAVVILSSAVGVEIVAHQMLVSAPDRNVVLVVVVMAALAGFAVALVVGHQVTSASRVLLNAVRDVGSIGYFEPPRRGWRPSSRRCPTNCPRHTRRSPNPGPGNGRWKPAEGNSSPGSAMTCAPRWPGCAPWRKPWKTGWWSTSRR